MILTAPVNNIIFKPVYLIHGYDAWQSIDALQKINAQFGGTKKYYFANFAQFIQFNQTNKSEIFNKDLFCESQINKLIEISIGNGKFTKPQLQELNNLLNNLNITNNLVVILIADKLDKTAFNSSWFKIVAEIGIVIVTKNLSKASMQNWAIAQFKKANLNITNDALIKFVNIHQNNLMDAKQSIDKLSIIFAKQTTQNIIDTEKLLKFIDVDGSKNSIFDLQNALAIRHTEQIISILNNLKEQAQEEILILWAIIQEIKNSFSKTTNLINQFKLANLFQKAAEIDLAIKNIELSGSNNYGYIWSLIIDLCLGL